jgi:hypothetical protein
VRKTCRALLAEELGGTAVRVEKINKLDNSVGLFLAEPFADGAKHYEEKEKLRSSAVFSQTPLAEKSGDLAGVGGRKNVNNNTSNHDKYSSSSLSFVPPSGIELDLDAYMNDPASCQPTKKALCGDQMPLITAAQATSTSRSPTRLSMYTNKKTAISSTKKAVMVSSTTNMPSYRNVKPIIPIPTDQIPPALTGRKHLTMCWDSRNTCRMPEMMPTG